MATTNDVDQLNGLFKEIYHDKIQDLIPEGVILYKEIPFVSESKVTGNLYHVPVVLGQEHGFSYGGPDGSAFTLNEAVAGVMKDATVQGFEMVLRSKISVGAISRSLKGGKQAFENASKHLVQNMLKSMTKRLEAQLMYGQTNIGVVASLSSQEITLEVSDFAPGIWAGAEGMIIDVFTAAGAVRQAGLVVSAIDFDTKVVTVVGTTTGIVSTDEINFKGAREASNVYNEFIGIDAIISQATGNLFGISTTAYSLWNGNVLDNGGTPRDLTLAIIEDAVEKAVEKGLTEQDVCALVNPASWNKLLTEQVAKRAFDQSYSSDKSVAGSSTIEFYGQNGKITVKPSIYCKQGSAYILCLEEFQRVGSRDISFDLPGFEGEFIFALENTHAYEMRAYTDQALLCVAPSKNTVIRDLN